MESVSCIICRRRKIKCDRRPVTCVNCAKFGTPCSYVDTSATSVSGSGVGRRASSSSVAASSAVPASATTTQAGLQRRRILRSCTACKRAKAKCSGGMSCTRCVRRNVECVYEGGRRDADAVSAGLAGTDAEYTDAVGGVGAAGVAEAYPVRAHPGFAVPQPSQPTSQAEPHPGTHLGPGPGPHGPHGAYPDRFAHQHTGYMPPPRLDPIAASPTVKVEQPAMPAYTASVPVAAFALHSPPTAPPPQTHTQNAHATHATQATASPPATNAAPLLATAAPPPPAPVPPWLVASSLPSMERLHSLIDSYFLRIHPLRCLGFLHMPTFHDRLRDQQALYYDSYGLVHAICALAAPFVYASETGGSVIPSGTANYCFFEAGHGWAATAMMRIFHHIGTPDVESLMTEMLLHEYYLRCGEYAKAFMLSGLVARHIQLLQLNLEHDCHLPHGTGDPRDDSSSSIADDGGLPWAIKESRRRLVWCCYLQDAFMECGIDQLRFVNPADIQVQLPCTEELFVRGKPCITEMLQPGKLLPFVAADAEAAHGGSAANLDLRAFYIRAMAIRAKILKYVKHLKGDIPWSKDPRKSRFLCLDMELRALENSVPHELRMNPENTSVFRWSGSSGPGGSGRLGLYFGVHILLAQTFNDLYRVGVANLVFPHHATQWIRTHAPLDFLVACHHMCITKAVRIASLLEEVWQTDRLSLVDTPYAMHAQVCSSVMVMTMISWQSLCSRQREQLQQLQQVRDGADKTVVVDTSSANLVGPPVDPQLVPVLPSHRRLLESNLATLDFLRCYIKADLYYESAKQALKRFEQLEAAARDSAAAAAAAAAGEPAPAPTDAPQYSLEYILNPLGVYPMARQQARNRHEPQTNPPPSTSEPTPTMSHPGTTSPLTVQPLDRSSAPVSTPEPPPVPMPNTPGQTMPAVDGSQTGNESGTHSMGPLGSTASAANTVSPQTAVGMRQGVAPQAYYAQRTIPMYDTHMTGIATTVGSMGSMDGMMGGSIVSVNDGVNSMNNANSINDMDINMTMGGVNSGMNSVGGMPGMDANLGLGMDASDGGEPAMFNMWNWASEAPSMDSMGYPTFLEAFQ